MLSFVSCIVKTISNRQNCKDEFVILKKKSRKLFLRQLFKWVEFGQDCVHQGCREEGCRSYDVMW